MDVRERFARKIRVNEETGCWEWSGYCRPGRGGIFTFSRDGRTVSRPASRVAMELAGVDVPVDKYIKRKCGTAGCVNPQHLYIIDDTAPTEDRREGELNSSAKLKDGDATLIRVLHNTGRSVARIAQLYSVSVQTVYKIVHGKRHVTSRERMAATHIHRELNA